MAGPGFSGISLFPQSAGSEHGFRPGAFVSLTVRSELSPGLYAVSIGPKIFTARSDSLLAPGAVLRARVENAGSKPVLKLVSALPTQGPASEGAVGGADGGRLAMAALLAEGLSPDTTRLARLARDQAASRGRGLREKEERLSLAARAEAKGIPAESGLLDLIQDLADGSARRGGSGRKQRQDRDEGQCSPKADSAAVGDSAETGFEAAAIQGQLPEERLPQILGSLLKALSLRAGGEGNPLHLFNHSPGGAEGGWVYVPFAFSLDSVEFSGTLKLQLPYIRGGPGRIEADFLAATMGGEERAHRWSLGLAFGSGLRTADSPGLRTAGGSSVQASAGPSDLLLRLSSEEPELQTRAGRFLSELAASLPGCAVKLGRETDAMPEVDIDA